MISAAWNSLRYAYNFVTGFFDQRSATDMMKESEKMQGFEHPHVLNITGVCVDAGSAPYIVMPFMANGSLLAYIKKEKMSLVIPNDTADEELASSYYQHKWLPLSYSNYTTGSSLKNSLIPRPLLPRRGLIHTVCGCA